MIKFIVTWKSDVADLPESGATEEPAKLLPQRNLREWCHRGTCRAGAINEPAKPLPLRKLTTGGLEKSNESGVIEESGESVDTIRCILQSRRSSMRFSLSM